MTQNNDRSMTTGDWFFTLLLLSIPLVNVILLIVWACGAGNRNRVTYCRASILWFVVAVLFYLLIIGSSGIFARL